MQQRSTFVQTMGLSMSERPAAQRVLLGLLTLQLCAAIGFVLFWVWGAKAPGPAVAAVVIALLSVGLKRTWIPPRLAVAAALAVSVLGLTYPWPWVRYEQQESVYSADVRRLAGPDGCMCVGLVVDQVWGAEDKPSGQAEAFCMPDGDERLNQWIQAGTVSTTWRLTFMHVFLDAPVIFARSLAAVDGHDANGLLGNSGCGLGTQSK